MVEINEKDSFSSSFSSINKESYFLNSIKINYGRWTTLEHKLFIEGLEKFGKNWKLIEKIIKTRSSSQIRSHAQKFMNKLNKKNFKINQRSFYKKQKINNIYFFLFHI